MIVARRESRRAILCLAAPDRRQAKDDVPVARFRVAHGQAQNGDLFTSGPAFGAPRATHVLGWQRSHCFWITKAGSCPLPIKGESKKGAGPESTTNLGLPLAAPSRGGLCGATVSFRSRIREPVQQNQKWLLNDPLLCEPNDRVAVQLARRRAPPAGPPLRHSTKADIDPDRCARADRRCCPPAGWP